MTDSRFTPFKQRGIRSGLAVRRSWQSGCLRCPAGFRVMSGKTSSPVPPTGSTLWGSATTDLIRVTTSPMAVAAPAAMLQVLCGNRALGNKPQNYEFDQSTLARPRKRRLAAHLRSAFRADDTKRLQTAVRLARLGWWAPSGSWIRHRCMDAVAAMDTITLIRSAIRGLLKVADEALAAELWSVISSGDGYESAQGRKRSRAVGVSAPRTGPLTCA
jgi:hypothetical protein